MHRPSERVRSSRGAWPARAGPLPSPFAPRGLLTAKYHLRRRRGADARPTDRRHDVRPLVRDSPVRFAEVHLPMMWQLVLPFHPRHLFHRKLLETFGDRGLFGLGWLVTEGTCG